MGMAGYGFDPIYENNDDILKCTCRKPAIVE